MPLLVLLLKVQAHQVAGHRGEAHKALLVPQNVRELVDVIEGGPACHHRRRRRGDGSARVPMRRASTNTPSRAALFLRFASWNVGVGGIRLR